MSFPFFFPLSLSLYPPFLTHSLSFLSFLSFSFPFSLFFSFFFPFLLTLPIELFDFLQVRGSFLSLLHSSFHVSLFPWSMCHMDTYSRWYSPDHMALISCVLLPWCHVATPSHAMWHHPMCHPDTQCLEKRKIPTISEFNKI